MEKNINNTLAFIFLALGIVALIAVVFCGRENHMLTLVTCACMYFVTRQKEGKDGEVQEQ